MHVNDTHKTLYPTYLTIKNRIIMKKKIMKIALAIAFLVMPTVCPAQGILGAILQATQQVLQQSLQQQQQVQQPQRQQQSTNSNSGYLIDQTYYNGPTYAPSNSQSYDYSSGSSSSTTKTCHACNGNGRCNACRNHPGYAGADLKTKCAGCHGSGICYICHGAGTKTY